MKVDFRNVSRRRLLGAALVAPLLGLAPWQPALAQGFPGSKPIRLVVPFPAGGGTDMVGRWIARGMAQELKGTVIVENVAGATGTLGAAQVARAAPDGYTLLMGISATIAIAPALYKHLIYKPDTSFTPLARIAHGGTLIVVHPSLPVKTVKDLIEMASKPGSDLIYGSWGVGSGGHLAMEALQQHAKLKMSHVPYKGVAPMLQDLLGGQIKIAAIDIGTAAQYVQSGKLRAIAATASKRPSLLPDVPTLVEQGVPFDTESWFAVFGPANMPAPVIAELTKALERVLKSPEAPKFVRDLGMEGELISREAFARQVQKDSKAWADIVEKGGIKME
jgi:tripartite-type tricarboxylate transporter receptor subunit TctC